MKHVLIITCYWPAMGSNGVQRWLRMSGLLPENGWQPVIYAADNAQNPAELEKNDCQEAEVICRPMSESNYLYKKSRDLKKEQNGLGKQRDWKDGLPQWIRYNLFIPDGHRYWIRPSVKFLKDYLKTHPVDAIISMGPPHSIHLIAMKLKEQVGLPWIADFRAPWTENDHYSELRLSKWANTKHHRLEQRVLTQADKVVTASPDWARRLGRLGNRNVRVIPNGFDNENHTVDSVLDEHSSWAVCAESYGRLLDRVND